MPERFPFKVITAPEPNEGLFPRGKVHPLLTVVVPAVLVIKTRLKPPVPLHVKLPPAAPSKFTVPLLCVKVLLIFVVKLPANVIVPDGAIKVFVNELIGALIVKVPSKLTVVYADKFTDVFAVDADCI